MSDYCSEDDLIELYGLQTLIRISDLNKDGQPDDEVVTRGIRSATGVINAYLQAKYDLPLSGTSETLREMAVDIAIYKMALDPTRRTTEMRQRYEDAIALLLLMSTGKAGLGVIGTPGSDGTIDTGGAIGASSNTGRSIRTYRTG